MAISNRMYLLEGTALTKENIAPITTACNSLTGLSPAKYAAQTEASQRGVANV